MQQPISDEEFKRMFLLLLATMARRWAFNEDQPLITKVLSLLGEEK